MDNQSVDINCKLIINRTMIMALRQTRTHTLPLFDHFLTNLLSSSLGSRNSSYPDAQLTRCATTGLSLAVIKV